MHPSTFTHSLLALAGASLATATWAADWPQFGYDGAHSGHNATETAITVANVAQMMPVYPSAIVLPAKVDSAPVYASGMSTSAGTRNLLFSFGTSSLTDGMSDLGTLMAIDADTGELVWSKTTSGSDQHASSSPAIDRVAGYVYSFGLDGYVHKYRIADGTEVETGGPAGWPQQVTLKPEVEKVASGLTIAPMQGTNFLEVVTDGYNGDGGDYQGHLVSINLASGARTVFNFMCSNISTLLVSGGCPSGRMSGAWGRGGATFDAAAGRIYATSGNGHFDADDGDHNWGDSVLAFGVDGSGLAAGLPRDSYTPTNADDLETRDDDLGSVSLALLPVPAGSTVAHLGMQTGKDAKLRLIDLDDMSGAGAPAHLGGEVQLLDVPQGGGVRPHQPAVWVDPDDGSIWLYVGNGNGLSALHLGLDGSHRPQLTEAWTKTGSASSPAIANGVLFVAGSCAAGKCVVARDPTSGDVLWTSAPIGDLHWQSPIVIDGAVYVIDSASKLWKFAVPLGDTIFADGFESPTN
jgi:outer membrane protein assembly factor BamB